MYQRFAIVPALTRDAKKPLNATVKHRVDGKEEDRGNGHHDEDHDGRDHGLAAAWPGHLCSLLTDLLEKLERIGLGHLVVLLPKKMAGAEGLEPSTCGFGDRRSTN
jgi:hypothetical protein